MPGQHTRTSSESRAAQPLILQENEGERRVRRPGLPNAGWPFIIKVDGQNGNAQDFFVVTEIMDPGRSIPFHKHHNSEEILILEEGGATVTVGNKRATAGARATVFIPKDTWVSVTNISQQPIHFFAIFSRQGFERSMRARSGREGEKLLPITAEEFQRSAAEGEAMFWDYSTGPYPPGVARP